MRLRGLAPAFPPFVYTQRALWEALEAPFGKRLRPASMELLGQLFHGNSGIETRRFFVEEPAAVFALGAQELNARFEAQAPALAVDAVRRALVHAGEEAARLDALFVATCTGYLCPGVSSHAAEALGLRDSACLHDLAGYGCAAAIPMLRAASDFLAANPGALVATVAVEVCSAAFYVDDDPGVLVSLCLFGDGAAAGVWDRAPGEPGWHAGGFLSLHRPEHRERIRFVNAGGKLKNQLHRSVPVLAARAVEELWRRDGGAHDGVVAHTGGREVLDAVEKLLPGVALPESRAVLREYGNLSSPSVLVALEKRLTARPGERSLWLTAFGAGFSAHACRLVRTG